MSLSDLNLAELQALLMEETKKFTVAMREGWSLDKKDLIRTKINEIMQELDKKKKSVDSLKDKLTNN